MPRARTLGIPGLAVGLGALSAYVIYAAVVDVPLIAGLRELLAGQPPRQTKPDYQPGTAATAGPENPTEGGLWSGPVDQSQTTLVRGIRVNTAIAKNLEKLLTAADADGVTLGGWGWRSTAAQRALRLKHGYPNDSTPSGAGGRLPVARPGTSRHEAGLAVDFFGPGRSEITRSSAGFKWLAANAGRYGFKNLPSEPWHWSTDGK